MTRTIQGIYMYDQLNTTFMLSMAKLTTGMVSMTLILEWYL